MSLRAVDEPTLYPELIASVARHLALATVIATSSAAPPASPTDPDVGVDQQLRDDAVSRAGREPVTALATAASASDRSASVQGPDPLLESWIGLLRACVRQAYAVQGGPTRVPVLDGGPRWYPPDRAVTVLTNALNTALPSPLEDTVSSAVAETPMVRATGRTAVISAYPAGRKPQHGNLRAMPRQPQDEELAAAETTSAGELTTELVAATRALGAATDLLGSHVRSDGAARSPATPDYLDLAVRAAGYQHVAAVTLASAMLAPAVDRLRAPHPDETVYAVTLSDLPGRQPQPVEVGGPATERMPQVGASIDAALQLRRLASVVPDADVERLNVPVAYPPIRTHDPLAEITDRVARLQRTAWTLPERSHVGATTLADLATAAALLFQAATLTRDRAALSRSTASGAALRGQLAWLDPAAAGWVNAIHGLRQLQTASIGLPGVRLDTTAVGQLLAAVTQPHHGVDPERLLPTLTQATRAQPMVANAITASLTKLHADQQLYVPGRDFTGDDIHDDPVLVTAKLKNRLAPANSGRIDTIVNALAAARQPISHSEVRPSAPRQNPVAVIQR